MAISQAHMNERVFDYQGRRVPYVYWSTPGRAQKKTIIFLGTVQVANLPKWVVEACPLNTIVVQGAPHWIAHDDGSDMPELMLAFTKCVVESLIADCDVQTMDVIAESQAVPAVLMLFSKQEYVSYLHHLVLVQPLGLNRAAFPSTRQERLRIFSRRIVANAVHQVTALLFDARLRYNHRIVRQTVGISNQKTHLQYDSGLKYDSVPDLKRLYEANQNIAVVCGGRDKIFPYREIIDTLARNEIDVEVRVINGVPHSPLATKYGQRLLDAALYTRFHSSVYGKP